MTDDSQFLALTIKNAEKHLAQNGYPASSLIVRDNAIISEQVNQATTFHDPTAHSEILCIRDAGKKLQTINLSDCTLYAAIEPCLMCLTACYWARITRIVFACSAKNLSKENYEGTLASEEITQNFNQPLHLIHIHQQEQAALSLIKNWEKQYRNQHKYL